LKYLFVIVARTPVGVIFRFSAVEAIDRAFTGNAGHDVLKEKFAFHLKRQFSRRQPAVSMPLLGAAAKKRSGYKSRVLGHKRASLASCNAKNVQEVSKQTAAI